MTIERPQVDRSACVVARFRMVLLLEGVECQPQWWAPPRSTKVTAATRPGRLSLGYDRRFSFTDNRCLAFADVRRGQRGRRGTEIGREGASSLHDSESQWGFHYLREMHHRDSERYRGPEGQKLFHVAHLLKI
jgi:hypothetical protein